MTLGGGYGFEVREPCLLRHISVYAWRHTLPSTCRIVCIMARKGNRTRTLLALWRMLQEDDRRLWPRRGLGRSSTTTIRIPERQDQSEAVELTRDLFMTA